MLTHDFFVGKRWTEVQLTPEKEMLSAPTTAQ
jgi:hypothetical protein